ncbi:MAG: ATPase [Acidobacteria bacterium]|nr:ATPase [Acidobacteriota bacterium]
MTATPELFLGVDGGQSWTKALIADGTGRILGFGHGGECNHVKGPAGRTKFSNAISGCVRMACEQAGFEAARVHFSGACLGFSGGAADKLDLLDEMIRASHRTVSHDGFIALVGATAGEPGIIAIAGTGQLCFGRNREGRTARAGGWGFLFGDEGGGFDTTRQALRAILRMEEGWGPPTALLPMLLEATGAASANDLLHRFYTTDYPRPMIAGFSKLVGQAADEGDGVAAGILRTAAQSLAMYTTAVQRQLFGADDPVRVAYIGGMFKSGLLRQRFIDILSLDDSVTVAPPRFSPVAGALIEAFRIAGREPDLDQITAYEKS